MASEAISGCLILKNFRLGEHAPPCTAFTFAENVVFSRLKDEGFQLPTPSAARLLEWLSEADNHISMPKLYTAGMPEHHCIKILLTLRLRPAAIALNYSGKTIQNDIRQKIYMKNCNRTHQCGARSRSPQ